MRVKSFPFILLICFISVLTTTSSAKKIKQLHKMEVSKNERDNPDQTSHKPKRIEADSTLISKLSFSGYDKPTTSSQETFHITNLTDTLIRKVGIRLTYRDLQNRMLHSREAEVECDIPAGETRIASIKSWDIQHTFYYYLGPEPKKTATPYKVNIDLCWIE